MATKAQETEETAEKTYYKLGKKATIFYDKTQPVPNKIVADQILPLVETEVVANALTYKHIVAATPKEVKAYEEQQEALAAAQPTIVLADVQEAASKVVADAELHASTIKTEADNHKATVETEAEKLRTEAEKLRTEAEKEAKEIVAKAKAEASKLTGQAKLDAEKLVKEAKDKAGQAAS